MWRCWKYTFYLERSGAGFKKIYAKTNMFVYLASQVCHRNTNPFRDSTRSVRSTTSFADIDNSIS